MIKSRKIINNLLSKYNFLNLKRDQWKNLQETKDRQYKRLKKIIQYAYDYVPYYHRLLSQEDIMPSDIKEIDDLKKIPLLSKQNILDLSLN